MSLECEVIWVLLMKMMKRLFGIRSKNQCFVYFLTRIIQRRIISSKCTKQKVAFYYRQLRRRCLIHLRIHLVKYQWVTHNKIYFQCLILNPIEISMNNKNCNIHLDNPKHLLRIYKHFVQICRWMISNRI